MAAARIRSVRFTRLTCLALAVACMSRAARGDVLVNDRSGDPTGAIQCEPRVTQVFNENAGEFVVVAWLNLSTPSAQSRTRLAVAQTPPDGSPYTFTFTNNGAPPAPGGYVWSLDPVIHGEPNGTAGVFYLAGRVRTPASPPTVGVGFARGFVTAANSVTFDHVSIVANFGIGDPVVSFFGATDMQVHPADGSIYVLYSPDVLAPDVRNIYFVRSTNGGATWSAPTLVSADSTSIVLAPRIVCGQTAGDVTFLWKQNDANPAYVDVLSRHSSNNGVTLDPQTLVMQEPVSFQTAPTRQTPFREFAEMDRSGGAADGTVLCASAISLDLTQDTFPAVAGATSITEVEPNGASATATLVPAAGDVMRGTIAALSDTDFYAFDLTQGQEVNALADSMPAFAVAQLDLCWLGADGKSMLTEGFPIEGGSSHFGFTAPAAGRYYLRVSAFSVPGAYRLRTVLGVPHAPGANDQRDVGLSRLAPGGSWTGTQLMQPLDAIGYDDNAMAMTSCVDGAVFASYNDFSVLPGRALSRRVLRRSSDGGATWSPPAEMSSASCDWSLSKGFDLTSADMATDGVRMYTVWSDGRNGDPDVFFRFVYRRIFMVDTDPLEMTVHPGQGVDVVRHVRNEDDLEGFDVRMVPVADWPLPSSTATLAPGQTAALLCSFVVPADATPGDVNVTIFYRSVDQPNSAFGIANVLLHVTGNAAVSGDRAAALDLAAPFPNPLPGSGELHFSLAHAGHARLAIYGLDGRRVRTLVDGSLSAGAQHVMWDGADGNGASVAPGAYFVQLSAEGRVLVRRFVLLR
jgi:hypothetical protein